MGEGVLHSCCHAALRQDYAPNLAVPHPVEDSFGYGVAIAMVLKSLDPGRYADHRQFESIRKMRATFSNIFMSSKRGTDSLRSFGGDRAKHVLTDSPTNSLGFFIIRNVRKIKNQLKFQFYLYLSIKYQNLLFCFPIYSMGNLLHL